jgi:hypothetical protein
MGVWSYPDYADLSIVGAIPALRYSRCGSPMKVLAVITDPPQVRSILLHLIKTGVAPPGPQAASTELITPIPVPAPG